jgi:hypothetical protein
MLFGEGAELGIHAVAAKDLFDLETVKKLFSEYVALLERFAGDPYKRIDDATAPGATHRKNVAGDGLPSLE